MPNTIRLDVKNERNFNRKNIITALVKYLKIGLIFILFSCFIYFLFQYLLCNQIFIHTKQLPHMKKSIFTAVLGLISFCGFSQEKEAEAPKFTFSGYIDSYYMLNFNNPTDRSNLGVAGNERAFDQKSNQFSLGLVQTKFGYSTKTSDVVVDLTFGPNADLGQYGNVIGPLGKGTTALAIKQAYFNWKASDKLTFTAGQFGTHIGYEVIDAPINYNYSLSNLFNNGPFYHVGLKANYAFSDKFATMVGLVNNVDNLNDNNSSKGLIYQVFTSPASGWNVYFNGISSNESNPLPCILFSGPFRQNFLSLSSKIQT